MFKRVAKTYRFLARFAAAVAVLVAFCVFGCVCMPAGAVRSGAKVRTTWSRLTRKVASVVTRPALAISSFRVREQIIAFVRMAFGAVSFSAVSGWRSVSDHNVADARKKTEVPWIYARSRQAYVINAGFVRDWSDKHFVGFAVSKEPGLFIDRYLTIAPCLFRQRPNPATVFSVMSKQRVQADGKFGGFHAASLAEEGA